MTRFVDFPSFGNLNTVCPQTPYFLCFKDTLAEEINEEMRQTLRNMGLLKSWRYRYRR